MSLLSRDEIVGSSHCYVDALWSFRSVLQLLLTCSTGTWSQLISLHWGWCWRLRGQVLSALMKDRKTSSSWHCETERVLSLLSYSRCSCFEAASRRNSFFLESWRHFISSGTLAVDVLCHARKFFGQGALALDTVAAKTFTFVTALLHSTLRYLWLRGDYTRSVTCGSVPESHRTRAWFLWKKRVVFGVGRYTENSEEVEVLEAVVSQATGHNANPDFLEP
jgi:hypothetical protein